MSRKKDAPQPDPEIAITHPATRRGPGRPPNPRDESQAGIPGRGRGRPPLPEGATSPPSRHLDYRVVSLKCTAGFYEWLEGFAKHERIPVTNLLERAIVDWSKRRKYAVDPPERIEPRKPAGPGDS